MNNIPMPAMHLLQEYEHQRKFFELQPPIVQRFLESQAVNIANAVISNPIQVEFNLPDRVTLHVKKVDQEAVVTLPESQRDQKIGGILFPLLRKEMRQAVLHRLQELENSPDQAISASASLLRFATATHMIVNMLPDGRSVVYRPVEDESIPCVPVSDDMPESAITEQSDAIVEQSPIETGRGELQTPFVPAARRFFLPQWVAFDEKGNLLVGSEKEAEACVQSMQKYVQILHRASSVAPYMVACEAYQRKRYGILGQLVNQGRALANFKTMVIILEIKERSGGGRLNRGLEICMPYFDDQNLVMVETRFQVIPAGRIMFVPVFVVRASRGEQAKVSQDTRLNSSTRKHLLAQLKSLEMAF